MTLPGRGCRTCKARRVKCDQARPICGQCMKSKRDCTGLGNVAFRNENAYASGVARRPRRAKVKPDCNGSDKGPGIRTEHSRPSSIQSKILSGSESIPISMGILVEDLALNKFLRTYAADSVILPLSIHSYLSNFILREIHPQSDTSLSLALGAVSLATFGQANAVPAALHLGFAKYTRALTRTKTAVSDGRQASSDHFLLTVIMLNAYERAVCDYNRSSLALESLRHYSGAVAILKFRKTRCVAADRDRQLDKLVRSWIVRQAVLHAVSLPPELQDGVEFEENGQDLDLDRCLVKSACLRSRVREIMHNIIFLDHESRVLEGRNLITEAQAVDRMLTNWADNLPPDWKYATRMQSILEGAIEKEGSTRCDEYFYDSTIAIYPKLYQAATWNCYRACRLITNSIISRVLRNADPSDSVAQQQRQLALSNTQTLVNDICASVPFHFDLHKYEDDTVVGITEKRKVMRNPPLTDNSDIIVRRACLLIWPLIIAQAVDGIQARQRVWIKSKLLLVSRVTGNGVLDVVTEINSPTPEKVGYHQSVIGGEGFALPQNLGLLRGEGVS